MGGVQTAYTLFKSAGITSKWLDALLGVGQTEGKEELSAMGKGDEE